MFVTRVLKSSPFLFCVTCLTILMSSWSVQAQTTTSVTRVITGDTVQIQDGRLVRLIGITSPLPAGVSHAGDPFGEEARKITESVVAGKSLELIFDNQNIPIQHKDKYGRTLAYLYILPQRTLVNRVILRQGGATVYTAHTNKYINDMYGDQFDAKRAKRGIWSQITESPEEIAQKQGKAYEEVPFSLDNYPPPMTASADPSPNQTSPNQTGSSPVITNEKLGAENDSDPVPTLDSTKYYETITVKTCAVLDIPELGEVALIGVKNRPGRNGEAPRVEVEKLVKGKKLRFSLEELNLFSKHRNRQGQLLVYAFFPDGSLLNMQIVAKGITDIDNDRDFERKADILKVREEARLKKLGLEWTGAMVTTDPAKLRANLTEKVNLFFGQIGGRVELVGSKNEVLRISHDAIDAKTAEQMFRSMSVSTDMNSSILRGIGIKEVQFTDLKVTNIIRYQL